MVVRAANSSILIFLNDEKYFIEKEQIYQQKLPQTDLKV